MHDTIAAVATSVGTTAGINIIRISGENTRAVLQRVFVTKNDKFLEPNYLCLGTVNGKYFKEKAFCVFYKAPKSFTGEDAGEIHCHGGKGVTSAVLRAVLENGARTAESGEFTKRAFLNGKMSLAEAEGIAEMIAADTESELKNAFSFMTGTFTKKIEDLSRSLVEVAALLEAKLDYPEELEEEVAVEGRKKLSAILDAVEEFVSSAKYSRVLKKGADIAIVGIPNAGKSSFLNAVLKQDRAIVTDIPGTTRDVLSESVEVDGIRLNFMDTAGIRESTDIIEQFGVERSRNAIKSADCVVFLQDLTVTDEEEREISELAGTDAVRVCNKTDIATVKKEGIPVCAKTGTGVERVLDEVLKKIDRERLHGQGIVTNERHLSALKECRDTVKNGLDNFDSLPSECILADIRGAYDALARITGRNVTDEVVDEIFSKFCVGK